MSACLRATFWFIAIHLAIAGRPCPAASPMEGVQSLAVVDKQDIRFVGLSIRGEPFKKRVLAIAQDNVGFVWLGTDDGLYRYDGYTLRHYRHDPNDSRSIGENTVLVLHHDHAGRLWIGMQYGGLDRYDPAQDAFLHYRHDPRDNSTLRDDHVLSIYGDSRGGVWVGTSDGFDRMDPATGRFFHYPHPVEDDPRSYAIWGLYEDNQGNLLVGCGLGLYKLDAASSRLSAFLRSPLSSGAIDADTEWFARDRAGSPWFTWPSRGLIGSVNPATGEPTLYSIRPAANGDRRPVKISRVLEDKNGTLWIGTIRDGLLKLDKERKTVYRYTTLAGNTAPGQIWALLEDTEGGLWVGSETGATRFQTTSRFTNYTTELRVSDSRKVLSAHADAQGFLWIGQEGGLLRLNRKTGHVDRYRHDPKDPSSLSDNAVSAIREDGSGGLWVGTRGGGLNRFDRSTGRFTAYRYDPREPQSLSSNSIMCLLVETDGALWIGTEGGGLYRFDPKTGRSNSYFSDPRNSSSLSDNFVGELLIDRSGTLWIGTNRGLNRLDRKTDRFSAYLHDERNPASLSNDGITSIHEDRAGTLWVGTRGGLNRLDSANGTFGHFNTQDGLASDFVEAIQEGTSGTLWLATHEGLSEFHPQSKVVRNHTEADGLPGHFANPLASDRTCVTPEGELVFGSNFGVTVFDPNRMRSNTLRPPVVLTDFLLFNKPVAISGASPLRQSIWATRSLTLDHTQSIFTIEFAALSYVAPERNRYRYKLDNLDPEWNQVGADRRTATYTSLPPGKYVFHAQGSNDDLLWNETGVRLEITVLPPWWGTWWFRSAVLASVVGLAFSSYQWRLRSIRLAAHRLELQVDQRTRELKVARDAAEAANRAKSSFLANMSHELRTPLNAILGFSSLLRDDGVSEQQRRNLEIINRSGEHLLHLIDNVLDLAKVESGRTELRLEPCDVKRLVTDVAEMMRERARQKNLALLVVESLDFPRLASIDAGKVRQVLINLIGNAVKFTEHGSVTVRAGRRTSGDRRLLVFEVEDTGIGIAQEDCSRIFDAFVQAGVPGTGKGTGLGLTISRQFVELMGGTMQVASSLGKGTQFRVELPADPAADSEVPDADENRIAGVDPGRPDCRVLIVEDGEDNRLVLKQIMEKSGFVTQCAENGARGVELFQDWRPHFIWMDLRMPVMGGIEAVRRIRTLPGGNDVKIAMVTASAFASEREQVMASGADDFLRKPYQPHEILDCMARHLGLRRFYTHPRLDAPGVPLNRELGALPRDLLMELRAAVVSLDGARLRKVIAQVSKVDTAVADQLANLASRFSYSTILNAVDAAGARPAGGDTAGLERDQN